MQRAQEQLEALTPCRVTAAGLLAGYIAACAPFMRVFDADYDIARVNREKLCRLRRLRHLFKEGHTLTAESTHVAGGSSWGQSERQ